nr:putative reverse transcriptase domain-containing protein [Tanacetum cinerariifolium]
MLKVLPWKRVVRFGKKGKLNRRYVRPFKVLEKVGFVAYKLEIPQELSRVHNTFYVSNLKKYYADEPLAVPLDGLHVDDKLHFVEKLVKIMDREVKWLKRSRIPIVKVCVLDGCFKKMASDMSKFLIPMFDGKMDFMVWKITIEDVLVQQGIDEALEEKQPAWMKDDVWKMMQNKASNYVDGGTTLTFEDVLKALCDNDGMTGSDSSSSIDKLLVADDSGRDLKSLRDSKGKKKVDGGEMNAVYNGGDEFLMTKTPTDGTLREEKPKWVLYNAASSHICNDRAMFGTLNEKGQFSEIKVG